MLDPDTVELLYRVSWDDKKPASARDALDGARFDGQPLTAAQRERLRRSTDEDWNALALLLAVDAHLLNVRRDDIHNRLRLAGLPCDLPPVR